MNKTIDYNANDIMITLAHPSGYPKLETGIKRIGNQYRISTTYYDADGYYNAAKSKPDYFVNNINDLIN